MSGKGRGLGIAAAVVGLLGLVLAFGGFAYGREAYGTSRVASTSMEPSYERGDRIVFERVDGSEVRRGDVVLYAAPGRYGFDELVMQRVVGVGGDRLVCCTGGRLALNGKPLAEPYVRDGDADGARKAYDVTVPRGRLFLLGDHRANSMDSRFFEDDHDGTVAASAVRGRITEEYTAPLLLTATMLLGAGLVLTGVGLGIACLVVRRRAAAAARPPWPAPAA
ncbi:signal peptidase I [Streptomyces dysideae]|nr:signal peptidase I [Streptomyces dysideae]